MKIGVLTVKGVCLFKIRRLISIKIYENDLYRRKIVIINIELMFFLLITIKRIGGKKQKIQSFLLKDSMRAMFASFSIFKIIKDDYSKACSK